MKTIKNLLVGLFLLVSALLQAENKEDFPRIEEMHNHKWEFLVTQAQLSPDEIDRVKPVFMHYEKTIWDLHQQNREFFKAAMKDAKKVNPNYADLNDRYVDFEFKQAQLFKNYHMQLRKLLQPETLFKYYKAEREFKRKLLQDFQDRRHSERPRPQ
ncbi:MAG TPA: hypothetical protein VI413_00185 [Paludibacter sp.]